MVGAAGWGDGRGVEVDGFFLADGGNASSVRQIALIYVSVLLSLPVGSAPSPRFVPVAGSGGGGGAG